jgi:hypothetical protein
VINVVYLEISPPCVYPKAVSVVDNNNDGPTEAGAFGFLFTSVKKVFLHDAARMIAVEPNSRKNILRNFIRLIFCLN